MENLKRYQEVDKEIIEVFGEELRVVMSEFYQELKVEVQGRQRWPVLTEEGIIVHPGDPVQVPAMALQGSGHLVYTNWGSVKSQEDITPITGLEFIIMARHLLVDLPEKFKAEKIAAEKISAGNGNMSEGSTIGIIGAI